MVFTKKKKKKKNTTLASYRIIECEDCKKHFHASCSKLGVKDLEIYEAGNETWYCRNCEAHCGLCRRMALNCHKAVQYDQCELRIHNE